MALDEERVAQVRPGPVEHHARIHILRVRADLLQGLVGHDAVADAILGAQDQVIDAQQRRGQRTRADDAHDIGNLDREVVAALGLVRDGDQVEGRGRGLGVPHGFHGRDLHLLVFGGQIAAFIAQHDHRQCAGQAEAGSYRHRALGQVDMTAAQQIPRADRHDEHGARHVTGADGMHELGLRDRVEDDRGEVSHFHAHRVRIEDRADRVLHPAVGDQDPQRREVRAEGHQPGHGQVADLGHAVPAEEEQADEGGFQEERHQPFEGQRRAEDVAHVVAVVGPVHAELELHHHARGHAQREVDAEQRAPEHRHLLPDGASGHDVHAFHDGQDERQAKRERHKDEMVERSRGELEPREIHDIEINHEAAPKASTRCGNRHGSQAVYRAMLGALHTTS